MNELEKYLTGDYARDKRDIADLEHLLSDASVVF